MKQKTHKGTAKRIKVTGSGKLRREQANRRHLLEGKPSTRTRRLKGTTDAILIIKGTDPSAQGRGLQTLLAGGLGVGIERTEHRPRLARGAACQQHEQRHRAQNARRTPTRGARLRKVAWMDGFHLITSYLLLARAASSRI